MPLLQNCLLLNRFMYSQFGCSNFEHARDLLSRQSEGYSEEGQSNFYYALKGLAAMQVPQDRLARYDLNIKEYVSRLRIGRNPALTLKYYQYLAILFSEYYLDLLFADADGMVASLNGYVALHNESADANNQYEMFKVQDLNKVAFWMATGSGKTLVMHVNFWQYLRYCPKSAYPENVLLITPNEGLSNQHRAELAKSEIGVRDLDSPVLELVGSGLPVTVIEITKLSKGKRGAGERIDVGSFGERNLVLVDEGHRGASGDLWRELRSMASRRGFTFEYSATFGEIVNGASAERRETLLREYSKAIIFDYSYPHFHRDGYGKDYWITNLKDTSTEFNRRMLLGNLLSFYEQYLAFEEHRETAHSYNLERPLWIFVGHSVTGGKTREDQKSLTDVEHIVSFLGEFLAKPDEWQSAIAAILQGQSGVKNGNDADLFEGLFPYLRRRKKTAVEIYEDIVNRIFHGHSGAALRVTELIGSSGELGIRAGIDAPYFALINVGDASGLLKMLESAGFSCVKDTSGQSLFEDINRRESTINILIGSRKFMEGWDSFRVSSMGLMNLGRGEGAQVIQLFGRGVRLWGKDRSLRRSEALMNRKPPDEIRVLETLSVFGIRADYMAKFREYVAREGIAAEYKEQILPIRVSHSFLSLGLPMLEPPARSFSEGECIFVEPDPSISVRLDLFQRADLVATASDELSYSQDKDFGFHDCADELRTFAPTFDWDRILLELLTFKRSKSLRNLAFNCAALQKIIESGRFEVIGLKNSLVTRSVNDLRRNEEIATILLKKYILKYYDRRRREWEHSRVRLGKLTEAHPNLTFQYVLNIREPFTDPILKVLRNPDAIYERESSEVPSILFQRHIYQPLLLIDWNERIVMTPTGLNEGERSFVEYLRDYFRANQEALQGRELYLLRNLTRGKGICFFEMLEGEAFYPDFILWVMEEGVHRMAFIDPHGLCHVSGGFDDPKLDLHRRIKELQAQLQLESNARLVLSSFIVSTTRYEYARKAFRREQPSKEQFEEHNVFFMEDGIGCVGKLLHRLIAD